MQKIIKIVVPALCISQVNAQSLISEKAFGGSFNDKAYCTSVASDGGIIIGGIASSNDGDIDTLYGGSDIWIAKLDANNNILWKKNYGGSQGEKLNDIKPTTDNGFILLGTTWSNDFDVTGLHGGEDGWLVKLDSYGNLQWQKCLGGTNNDVGKKVIQTVDGGYLIVAEVRSTNGDISLNHGTKDIWVCKLDAAGNIEWEKSYGGSLEETPEDLVTISNGYIIIGSARSNNGDITLSNGYFDVWILQIDFNGNILNQRCFGGTMIDWGTSIALTLDGGYIFSAYSYSDNGDLTNNKGQCDYWIVKLFGNLQIQWQLNLGGSNPDWPTKILQTYDGNYTIAGWSLSSDGDVEFNHGSSDLWILKMDVSNNMVWQKSLGGSGPDACNAMIETGQNLILVGYAGGAGGDVSLEFGNYDYWLARLDQDLSSDEQTIQNEITIYPNPSTGNFTIQSSEKNYIIEITDVFGRLVYADFSQSESFNVALDNKLSAGTYFVKILNEKNYTIVNRIVIE